VNRSLKYRFLGVTLIFTHLFVFHTEKVAFAQGAATSASAMSATQNLLTLGMPEAFQVDLFTGRAATGYPIPVPPGRKAMQPSIELGYASTQRNGWLGVGWDLDLGLIERDTKKGTPRYDSTDVFHLRFGGTNSALVKTAGGDYRLANEGAFLKIEFNGSSWLVRDKSGTKFYFGQTNASRLDTARGTFEWRLDRVEDTNGNFMEITYQKDGAMLYPDECRYAGHVSTGLAPANLVKFILENRPDPVGSLISGEEVRIAKRLKEIQVYAGANLARRFTLNYHQSAETGRSMLDSIAHLGATGDSLPPVKFSYQEDSETMYSVRQNTNSLGNRRWMVRTGAADMFHNNESLLLPTGQFVGVSARGGGNGASIPFGQPSDALAGGDGAVNWSQDGQGGLHIQGSRDSHFHAFTYFFLNSAATINLPAFTGANMATGVFINGNQQAWFGGPQVEPIRLQAGYNLIEFTGYNQNNNYQVDFNFNIADAAYSAVSFMNSFQFIQPQFVGDFNGDGLSDFAIYDPLLGEAAVSISRTFAFLPKDVWIRGFGNISTTPFLGDFNRDGKTDWGIFDNGTWRVAYSNGADVFQAPVTWKTGFGATGDRPVAGDFNGDGLIDAGIFKSSTGRWEIALSNGSAFGAQTVWHANFGANQTPFSGDFNGDGLLDILAVNESTGAWRVALSNGSAFLDRGIWASNFGAGKQPVVFDCNGDGVTDIGFYDYASGTIQIQISNGASAFDRVCQLDFEFSFRDPNMSFQPGDFTGDGLLDPAIFNRFTSQGEVALSNGKMPDLLTSLENSRGGRTRITYKSSAAFMNEGGDGVSDLPFVMPLIDSVTQSDGLGNRYTTKYSARGGKFDFADHEFRGFEEVIAIDPLLNVTRTKFAQDDIFKGRILSSTVLDGFGNRWSESRTVWDRREISPGIQFVFAAASETDLVGGDTTFRTVRTEYAYDNYGNVTEARELGDVLRTGDERITRTDFEYREADWLVSLVSESEVLESDGATRVSSRSFEYDGAGSLRFERVRLNDPRIPGDREIVNEFRYDSFGNIAEAVDPRGNISRTFYDDATHAYPVRTLNALGHTEEFEYDARFGEITLHRDANGAERKVEFDSFGRAATTWNPQDPVDDPTTVFSYDDRFIDANGDGIGEIFPSVTQLVKDSLPGDGVFRTQSFYDGFGRMIQTRSESEDSAVQIVSGSITFDERGLPKEQFTPYFENYSENFIPVMSGGSLKSISFSYDALGRRTEVHFPDGTVTRAEYDDFIARTFDAKGNPKETESDGLGRTIAVREFLEGNFYVTRYTYDAGDRLRQINDFADNLTQIAYDSAGRKISLNDPDSGLTEYEYDLAGNIIKETDALGIITNFTYDALNRPAVKSFSGTVPPGGALGVTTFTYDGAEDPSTPPASRHAIGRLTQIVDDETTTYFDYDIKGRLKQAGRFIVELGTAELGVERTYDRLSREKTITYPDGQIVSYTYNAQGGIESLSLCRPRVSGDPQGESGDPICETAVSNFDYNAAGQLTRIDYANGVSTGYFYSPETLRLEHLITQENLLANDLVNPLSYSPTIQTRQALHYDFDDNGNITTLTDQIHTATQNFFYDSLDRLTKSVSAGYGTQTFKYDPAGNLIEKSVGAYGSTPADGMYGRPVGSPVRMNYGESSAGPHAVTSAFMPDRPAMPMAYDAAGNMIQRGGAELSYDQNHRLRKITQADNKLRTINYELKAGWNLISFPVLPVNEKAFADGYVPVSVGAQFIAPAVDGAPVTDVLARAGLTFGEDISQISRFNSSGEKWEHFVGDPDFNQFETFETGVAYQVYAERELHFSVTGLLPSSPVSRTLTAGNNLIGFAIDEEVPASEIGSHYSFSEVVQDILRLDPATQTFQSLNAGEFSSFKPGEGYVLVGAHGSAPEDAVGTFTLPAHSRTSEFKYDSSGSRVMKTVSGDSASTSFFLGEGFEIDVDEECERKSIFAGDLRLLTVEIDVNSGEEKIRFLHPDHLGSSSVVTDEEGSEIFHSEFGPYGEVTRTDGASPSSFGFTDQEHDPSGLIYMNARYYDPLSGRFTSPDEVVQDPFDPQFLNRYTYVRNNPVKFVDPSGLVSEVAGTAVTISASEVGGGAITGALLQLIPVVNIIALVFTVWNLAKFFRALFHNDSDNSYHGVVAIEIIKAFYLPVFAGLSGGVQAVAGDNRSALANFPSQPGDIFLFSHNNARGMGISFLDTFLNIPAGPVNYFGGEYSPYSHSVLQISDNEFLNFTPKHSEYGIRSRQEIVGFYGSQNFSVYRSNATVDREILQNTARALVRTSKFGYDQVNGQYVCTEACAVSLEVATGLAFQTRGVRIGYKYFIPTVSPTELSGNKNLTRIR